jgi:hypothetical protein
MASISQKVPIPIPVEGVIRDRSVREVGARGLVSANNWILMDGEFRVRPGLSVVQELNRNLFQLMGAGYEDVLAYINEKSGTYFEDTNDLYTEMHLADTPGGESDFNDKWWPWKSADATNIAANLSWQTHGVTDPDFLDVGGDGYAYYDISAASGNEEVVFYSPVVAIDQGAYEGQIEIAMDGDLSPLTAIAFAKVELCFFILGKAGSARKNSWTPVGGYSADSVTVYDLDWSDDNGPQRVSATNSGTYTHAALKITFSSNLASNGFAFTNAMINRGSDSAEFAAPSDAEQTQIGAAKAITTFEDTPGSEITVLATENKWYELSGSLEWTEIDSAEWSSAPANPNSLPVFRAFDGYTTGNSNKDRYLIGANGESNAMFWNGTDAAQTLTEGMDGSTTIQPRCIAVSSGRILYGNLKNNPSTVAWTEALTISDWETNNVDLADTPGYIVAMLEMGNLQTAIYKSDAIYMAIAQGSTQPFRFELKTANVDGPASPRSIVAISDGTHIYLSNTGDVVIFDGVRPRSMGQKLQAYIQSDMDTEKMDESFSFYDKENKNIYFFYPPYNSSAGHKCIVVDVSGQVPALWPLSFPGNITTGGRLVLSISKTIDQLGDGPIDLLQGTIDSYGSSRPILAILNNAGEIFFFEGYSDCGEPITHHIETGAYDLGNITNYLTVKEIDHLFDASANQSIDVELLTTNFGGEKISDGKQTVDLIRGQRKLSAHRATGRIFSMRMSGKSTGKIEWLGSEASVVQRGLR